MLLVYPEGLLEILSHVIANPVIPFMIFSWDNNYQPLNSIAFETNNICCDVNGLLYWVDFCLIRRNQSLFFIKYYEKLPITQPMVYETNTIGCAFQIMS